MEIIKNPDPNRNEIAMSIQEYALLDKEKWGEISIEAGFISEDSIKRDDPILPRPIDCLRSDFECDWDWIGFERRISRVN